jgi:hypothetical protein
VTARSAPEVLPAEWKGPRFERIREAEDEPRFPDPYMAVYENLVADMESDMAVLPGMGTLAKILIRRVARDHVAALMADRQDSIMVEIRCSQGHVAFAPLWPENNARLLRSASELLKQARSADLGHALRTEFVLGLVTEVMSVLEQVPEESQRVALKESMRDAFRIYLEGSQKKRGLG